MMVRRLLALVCATLVTLGAAPAPAAAPALSVTGQLLAYQQGYLFFTSGNGFRVAPGVRILDDKTKAPTPLLPRPRLFARAVFNAAGQIVEIDLSKSALPLEPLSPQLQNFVVAASPSYPNPELAGKPPSNSLTATNTAGMTFSGKPVLVVITVEVPPTTPLNAEVYIATDASGWNPQAIAMQRVDALHFRVVRRIASGTILHYIYTRGSLQTEERGQNGLDEPARTLLVSDADVRAVKDHVYQWADQNVANGRQILPDVQPTPFNPAPFPNLPSSVPTPHPR